MAAELTPASAAVVFGVTDEARWEATVTAAPRFETYATYYASAVPQIARQDPRVAELPCVVIASVTDMVSAVRSRPAGPKDRAKGLLDALHDQRPTGPYYRDLNSTAPLPNDDPNAVRGLAVQVSAGTGPSVLYSVGNRLTAGGERLGVIDVDGDGWEAPNDIRESGPRLIEERERFAGAVVAGWMRVRADFSDPRRATAVLIRHQPFRAPRDEDNTWSTWLASIRGTSSAAESAWHGGCPFAGCSLTAVASLCEPDLGCDVRYEFLAGPSASSG